MIKDEKLEDLTELKNNWTESVETFDQLEIKEELLRGVFGTYLFKNLNIIVFHLQ